MSQAASTTQRSVSIVTQTCVRPERSEDFARWQSETSSLIQDFPGFIEQRLLPPAPPLQVDWVILQRFASLTDAQRWLGSVERQKRIEGAAPMLVGRDDVHIVQDEAGGIKPAPVSAVISTRVLPGKEAEYRVWERKIAAAQSKARGLQGYRFEPPVPGVQEDYVAILRFDTEANLKAWLDSPERKKLVDEAAPLTEEFHARIASAGFEQWFRDVSPGGAPLPVWKMDMLVLLMLYPIVFLWSVWIGMPYMSNLSFAVSLFIGNIVSVGLTGFLVPWVANRFGWWLQPAGHRNALAVHFLGAGVIMALYAAMIFVFWRFF
jgi:antibiotic biosynthesis monooxygenase (ABM) superfamily enzyme